MRETRTAGWLFLLVIGVTHLDAAEPSSGVAGRAGGKGPAPYIYPSLNAGISYADAAGVLNQERICHNAENESKPVMTLGDGTLVYKFVGGGESADGDNWRKCARLLLLHFQNGKLIASSPLYEDVETTDLHQGLTVEEVKKHMGLEEMSGPVNDKKLGLTRFEWTKRNLAVTATFKGGKLVYFDDPVRQNPRAGMKIDDANKDMRGAGWAGTGKPVGEADGGRFVYQWIKPERDPERSIVAMVKDGVIESFEAAPVVSFDGLPGGPKKQVIVLGVIKPGMELSWVNRDVMKFWSGTDRPKAERAGGIEVYQWKAAGRTLTGTFKNGKLESYEEK